jgi:hypothetical protein
MTRTTRTLEYRIDSVIFAEANEQIMCPSGVLATVPRGDPTHAR